MAKKLLLVSNPSYLETSWTIISSAFGVNLDIRMLDKILYVVYKSDMPPLLLHSVSSPFLQTGTLIDNFHCYSNSSLFQR
jgi:hypothetical protein